MKKILILFVIALLINCSDETDVLGTEILPGSTSTQKINHDGLERQYLIYIPNSYNGQSKLPLMINFHGFGGEVNDHLAYTDMRSLADSENFILIYPQGSELGGYSHWNAALNGGDNKSTVDDLGFVEALINLHSDIVNLKRVYAVGYSNGGMMSYALACYKSYLIAAIGSVSGSMLQTDCTPSHSIPLIKLHGTSDSVISYDGNSYYSSVESILGFWINFNKTSTSPVFETVDDNGTTIQKHLYDGGTNESSIEHYKILNGSHVWFDINFEGNNTNELIWNFVSKHDINGLRK
jgi:polyhydroxybutyrate depolymerase|tara:strand:+ start:1167 stop:2048 length:882 start_codon:yes stop_codon:yes gene_type:complete